MEGKSWSACERIGQIGDRGINASARRPEGLARNFLFSRLDSFGIYRTSIGSPTTTVKNPSQEPRNLSPSPSPSVGISFVNDFARNPGMCISFILARTFSII